MATYERFTDRARKVMTLANQQAMRLHHQQLDTEHMLLGLAAEGSGIAAHVLKNLGVDFESCRLQVEKLAPPLSQPATVGELPLSSRLTQLIEMSLQEAAKLNHHYVGTEHLILGLARQKDGVAAQALANLGLKLLDIRHEVLNLLGHALDDDSRT